MKVYGHADCITVELDPFTKWQAQVSTTRYVLADASSSKDRRCASWPAIPLDLSLNEGKRQTALRRPSNMSRTGYQGGHHNERRRTILRLFGD